MSVKSKTNSDQQTLNLIRDVQSRKAEIAKALAKPNYKTNMAFSYTEGEPNKLMNLHVLANLRELILIASFLRDKAVSYHVTALDLGLDTPYPDFTWLGFGVSDWIEDIKVRVSRIQVNVKQAKLEALEKRLNSVISPELRAQMELEAIANELS
jgi:hypothetical protein